jgi:hypothetical protein
MLAATYTPKHRLKPTNQVDRLMPHTNFSHASSSSSEESNALLNADSSQKRHESDDDGSQRPSPSHYWQQQANKNADGSQDDDESDNESDNVSEGPPELCYSDDEEAVPSAAAVSHESIIVQFSELTRQFATLVEHMQKLDLMSRKSARQSHDFDTFD